MTGTADTEAEEFAKIYKLDVMVIPTNRELLRVEEPDTVYRTEREKYDAIVTDIIEKQAGGRPTLVGTVSIEKSERLSSLLKKRGVKHVVLNAKYHAQEAEIVAQAGRRETVTIATNMAGRGTDILLGGNAEFMARQQSLSEEVAERLSKEQARFVDDDEFVYFFHLDSFYRVPRADWDRIFGHFKQQCDDDHNEVVRLGGLHIIATERHEARRIDNQLRGRAGRQGDPGSSRFYLSLEDDLMRIFGSDRIAGLMQRLGMEEGVPIEHGMVTRAIERAQKQVEAQNFSVRKHLLEYDDVMNKQRENIYTLRRSLLEDTIRLDETEETTDAHGYLMALAGDVLDDIVERFVGAGHGRRGVGPAGAAAGDHPGLRLRGRRPQRHRVRQAEHRRDSRRAVGAHREGARGQGSAARARVHAPRRARHHAADRGPAVEGPPLQPRPPEGRHRPARLRPARSAGRVQARELRALPGHEGPDRGRHRPAPLAPAGDAERGRRRRRRRCGALRPAAARRSSSTTRARPRRCSAAAPPAAVAEPANPFAPKPARVGGDDATVKTQRRDEPKVGRNDPCPCGSGKKYKKCHGVGA